MIYLSTLYTKTSSSVKLHTGEIPEVSKEIEESLRDYQRHSTHIITAFILINVVTVSPEKEDQEYYKYLQQVQ